MSSEKHPAFSNVVIHIIGSSDMQNQLLSNFIREKTGSECMISQSIENVTHDLKKEMVILWDCRDQKEAELLNDIRQASLEKEKVLLFNVNKKAGFESDALQLGISGFIYKNESFSLIPKAIIAVLNKELWLSRSFMSNWIIANIKNISLSNPELKLTPKELEILKLISRGASNKEIADKLFISCNTVKTHVYNIFKKINVDSRLQAAIWAGKNLNL